MYDTYGPVYKTHLFGKPMVRVAGEKFVANLLNNDYDNFQKSWMKTVQDLLGPFALTNSPVQVSQNTYTLNKKRNATRVKKPYFFVNCTFCSEI